MAEWSTVGRGGLPGGDPSRPHGDPWGDIQRDPIRESFWQRGCNDGYAGAPRQWPNSNGPNDQRNRGYSHGWLFGSMKRTAELRAGGVAFPGSAAGVQEVSRG